MTFELIKKINWVDLFILIVFIRTLYIGLKRGFIVEFFKLLGLLFAVVIAFHYYTRIADFLNSKSPLPIDLADFVSLALLSCAVVLIFKFMRDAFLFLVKAEMNPTLDKWLGFILSAFRSFVLSSFIIVLFISSGITYLQASTRESLSQSYLLNVSPRLYSSCFENLIVKFFPAEQINPTIFDNLEAKDKK